jgi:phosphatidylglycerophosphatase A
VKEKIALILATWFGSGLIPPIFVKGMAGTYGSIASLPICYVLVNLCHQNIYVGMCWYILMFALLMVLGLWSVPIAELVLGPQKDWEGKTREKDQNQIVIDEVAGMLVSCVPLIFVSERHFYFIGALAVFRVFDIWKPQPIKSFDKMKSGFGVMMDDVIAGLYAATIVWFATKFW